MTAVGTTLKPIADNWEWQYEGSCNNVDPETFFLEPLTRGKNKRDKERAALAICKTCPVKQACLNHALSIPEVYGVWGGMTEDQRQVLIEQSGIVHNTIRVSNYN
jgi:WhiB family transcriptional regulator, redox-sensing transcriptional regulator